MKWVVVDKACHRPIVGDDLARALDQLVEFLIVRFFTLTSYILPGSERAW